MELTVLGHQSPGPVWRAFHSLPSLNAQVRTTVRPAACMASNTLVTSCRRPGSAPLVCAASAYRPRKLSEYKQAMRIKHLDRLPAGRAREGGEEEGNQSVAIRTIR